MSANRNPSAVTPAVQLDIFEDSREVMLRNDAVLALEQRDAKAAALACDRLRDEFPADDALPALRSLVEALACSARGPCVSHDELRAAGDTLETITGPAALRAFGEREAAKWLAVTWGELARRGEKLPFRGDDANTHAAPLWLRAGRWNDAAHAVDSIESWRRIPAPLAWMCEARLHLVGLQATWPMLVELAWLSPRRVVALAPVSPDPLLPELVRRFEANFEGTGDGDDLAWFAAWVLTERPRLVKHLAAAQPAQRQPPEQAFRLLVELLGLEGQSRQRDIVERRQALRDLNLSLYEAYLKPRC